MKGYTVKCPKCGTLNKSLFLEETEGKYECEFCGHIGLIGGYRRITQPDIKSKRRKKRLKPLLA